MEKFIVSSDDCLILKAFKESSSLREAAKLLNCDPAGLARRVQVISSEYGFLQKINGRWCLTSGGLDLVAWTEETISISSAGFGKNRTHPYRNDDVVSEQILVPNLPKLQKKFQTNVRFKSVFPVRDLSARCWMEVWILLSSVILPKHLRSSTAKLLQKNGLLLCPWRG